jgi:hypothetical protein
VYGAVCYAPSKVNLGAIMADTKAAQPTNVTTAAKAADVTHALPAEWPGAFGVYKYSRAAVMLNVGTFVLLWVIDLINGGIGRAGKVGSIVSIIISLLLTVTFICTQLASARGKKIDIGEAFNQGLPFVLKMFVLGILVGLSLAVSFILLIVPFLFVLPRLSLAHYYLIDKKMGILDAYKASWNETKGHAGKIWGVIGVSILMILPVITIVGIIATIYLLFMYNVALALVYMHITKSQSRQS